jgi:septal ring factor EnvC (AmiA/AmiB activator)
MNKRPTPETDAFFARNTSLMEKWEAMKVLERELAEARAQLREEQHLHTATLNERDRLAEALESFLSQSVAPLAPLREALAAVKGEQP